METINVIRTGILIGLNPNNLFAKFRKVSMIRAGYPINKIGVLILIIPINPRFDIANVKTRVINNDALYDSLFLKSSCCINSEKTAAKVIAVVKQARLTATLAITPPKCPKMLSANTLNTVSF